MSTGIFVCGTNSVRSSTCGLPTRIAGAIAAVSICALIKASLGVPILPFLFFFPAIMLSSFYLGRVGGIVAATASTLEAVYFFIPPTHSFVVQDVGIGLGVIVFFGVATSVALTISMLRENGDKLQREVASAVAEIERANEMLRQTTRMEAIGQLTGGVAHDFNNLLTVIRSSVDLLKRPNLPEARRIRYVDAISETVDRAAKLTGQLLAFARRQTLKPEVFSVSNSVRALADMMRTLTGSRIQLVIKLPNVPCFINADASQFDTALVNLAANARDAMNGEGKITIEATAIEAIPAAQGRTRVEGSYVAVALADTGSGIPPELIERIFEPFFTTKEVGKGTGLGLSQVFGFAKQSGGDVAVASTLGEGTTFTIFLPRVAAPDWTMAPDEPEALVDGHGLCVLVVEDNVDVGAFAVQTLSELGYSTVLATDGRAALAELAGGAERFDVVFSDVVMPGMTGIELGQQICSLYHDLPVVLTSGYSHVLAQNGTYGFELLQKPYSVEQLSQMLTKAATWQRRQRLLAQ